MKKKKEIFLVPYSHLDTQWRWEYPTTINKYIKNTLDESIYMFDKYSEHRFNFTGALRYAMMKDYFPDKFNKVKDLVDEGRWHLAGTCLDETDVLVPSVESMVRNILYGDRWQKDEFGISSRDYMIPDCFGFPANMPSVMVHCGIQGFSTNKLTWGSVVGVPFEIGMWKGPDNTEIVSAFNPGKYESHFKLPIYFNLDRKKRLTNLGEKNDIWKSFQYYGVGDIGGAPTEGSVKRALSSIRHYDKKNSDMVVRQGSADEFFGEITEDEKKKMDQYEGDLLLTNHSAGTLTSAAIMKRWNRKNEKMAFAAEAAAVTAMLEAGVPYPSTKVKSAWQRIIGSQMHDILPGTSTPTAYEYSQNDEVVALNTWQSILMDSATAIAPYVKGDGNILIFNPIGETREELVTVKIPNWTSSSKYAELIDADGNKIDVQINNDNGLYSASFLTKLKPLSWSRYSIKESDKNIHTDVTLMNENNEYILENKYVKVIVTNSGKVISIFDKVTSKEILKKPMAYEFQKERPLKFPAWNMDWRDRKKDPAIRIEEGIVSIKENCLLKSTLQIETKFNESIFIKEISLSKESKMVEFVERLNWRGTGGSLKLAINTNLNNPQTTYNWETSRINRGINYKKLFEMPSRMWVSMAEKNFGFSLIEDSKYGYDRPSEDTLRMTLLYTPALRYYNGFWDQKSQDWGEHTIKYAIHPNQGDWKNTDVIANKFNQPVRSFMINNDISNVDKKEISLVKSSTEQLSILSIKKLEDTDDILIRVCERHGEILKGKLTFTSNILSVTEVNGLEEVIGKEIKVKSNSFDVSLNANGIKSFMLKLEDEYFKAINEKPIKLDYDFRLIGGNNENSKAVFPVELTPEVITSGVNQYSISTNSKFNAISCDNQEILIPENYNTLSILTSAKEEVIVPFICLDENNQELNRENKTISSMTGFIGLWDTRTWKREPKHFLKNRNDYAWINKCTGVTPGFINRNRLEWYSTHTHLNGKDQAYKYGHMYTVKIDIPKGTKKLVLPNNKNVYVIAMTASNKNTKVESTQYFNDKFDF